MPKNTEIIDFIEGKASGKRLPRAVLLYFEPSEKSYKPDKFAQCESCMMWTGEPKELCHIHGPDEKIVKEGTCGLYVNGKPMPDGPIMKLVTKEQSGYEERPVRCENCKHGNPDTLTCEYMETLNKKLPTLHSMDSSIKPLGCCNANQAK